MDKDEPNQFTSTHNLDFEVAQWHLNLDPTDQWMRFRVGTCEGLWRMSDKALEILAVANTNIGNGHFTDTLEWFIFGAKQHDKDFVFCEVWNEQLYKHLTSKKGFMPVAGTRFDLVYRQDKTRK